MIGDLPLNINYPRADQNIGKKRRHRFCNGKDDVLAIWRSNPAKPVIDKLAILHHGKTIALVGRQKGTKLPAITAHIQKSQTIQILARGGKS